MPTLLVVHHSPTAAVRRLTDAVVAGAHDDAVEGVDVVVQQALEPSAAAVLGADGVLLGTPANFGYMSGALKHWFDTVFLEVGGALSADGGATGGTTGGTEGGAAAGRTPYGLWVHGRYDTTGAVRSVQTIVQALTWRQVAPVLEVLGDVDEAATEAAYELGATAAALLMG